MGNEGGAGKAPEAAAFLRSPTHPGPPAVTADVWLGWVHLKVSLSPQCLNGAVRVLVGLRVAFTQVRSLVLNSQNLLSPSATSSFC
jgi:hypothetical protein